MALIRSESKRNVRSIIIMGRNAPDVTITSRRVSCESAKTRPFSQFFASEIDVFPTRIQSSACSRQKSNTPRRRVGVVSELRQFKASSSCLTAPSRTTTVLAEIHQREIKDKVSRRNVLRDSTKEGSSTEPGTPSSTPTSNSSSSGRKDRALTETASKRSR